MMCCVSLLFPPLRSCLMSVVIVLRHLHWIPISKLNTTIILLCAGGGGHLLFLWISTSQLCRLFNFQLFECSSKMSSEEKLCFLVCWEDKNAGLLKNFHLYFYPSEKSVEMFDLRIKKVFLKKTETSQIKQGAYPLIQTR